MSPLRDADKVLPLPRREDEPTYVSWSYIALCAFVFGLLMFGLLLATVLAGAVQ